ncbi:hypothetical protein TNCV_5140001 [Trichonephila clavipes]|nr:hypothetical protein TNCV_5140001 [Trichonephila clavipes]
MWNGIPKTSYSSKSFESRKHFTTDLCPEIRTLPWSKFTAVLTPTTLKKNFRLILGTGIWADSSIPYLDLKVPCDVVPGLVG